MSDPEDDPRFKELMRQIEAVDIPDYPDWKRGLRWGLSAGITVGILVALFLLVSGRIEEFGRRVIEYGWTVVVIALVVFFTVGAIGTFRPQNLR